MAHRGLTGLGDDLMPNPIWTVFTLGQLKTNKVGGVAAISGNKNARLLVKGMFLRVQAVQVSG